MAVSPDTPVRACVPVYVVNDEECVGAKKGGYVNLAKRELKVGGEGRGGGGRSLAPWSSMGGDPQGPRAALPLTRAPPPHTHTGCHDRGRAPLARHGGRRGHGPGPPLP